MARIRVISPAEPAGIMAAAAVPGIMTTQAYIMVVQAGMPRSTAAVAVEHRRLAVIAASRASVVKVIRA